MSTKGSYLDGRTRRHRSYTLPCATAIMLFAVAAVAVQTKEPVPNDTILTATPLSLPASGGVAVLEAFVGDGEWGELDVDIYALAVQESTEGPVLLTVEVTTQQGSSLDAYLRIFDPTGHEIANNDDWNPADVNPRIQTYLLETGTYFIGVSSCQNPHYDNTVAGSGRSGTVGGYALTVMTKPVQFPASSLEPNDNALDATPMGGGTFVITGEFIGDGDHGRLDVDIYQLVLTGPARISVDVCAHATGSVLDPVIRLRTCASSIPEPTYGDYCDLGVNDDAGASTDSALTVGVPQAEDVYIMVSGAGNRRYNPTVSGSGESGSVGYYNLDVTVTYFDGEGEDEPNDSIVSAVQLYPFVTGRPETVEIDGFLGGGPYSQTRGDRDFYEVRVLGEHKTLTVEVSALPESDFEPVLAVYDSAGQRLATGSAIGTTRTARVVLPVACVYPSLDARGLYVMVMGTRQPFPNDPFVPWPGEHRLDEFRVAESPGSTGPYHLTVSASADDELCGSEPNDTIPEATPTGIVDEGFFTCNDGVLGDALCDEPERDADLWELRVDTAPARLRGWITVCDSTRYYEYDLRVFDENGDWILWDVFWFRGDDAPYTFDVTLGSPGRYYVALFVEGYFYDPWTQCSANLGGDSEYNIAVMLTQRGSDPADDRHPETDRTRQVAPSQLFATRLDGWMAVIDTIDPSTGKVENSFASPEYPLGGSEGLAFDATDLYFVGTGRYPTLYQLDAHTGTVRDEYILWHGSGYYSDAVMLGGQMYIMDFYARALHVIDPLLARTIRTLRIGSINGITVSGGLAALTGVDRLYAADAFNTGAIYEIDPLTGIVTSTLSSSALRPTGLAGIGNALLYVVDWLSSSMDVISRADVKIDEVPLDNPAGTLAGTKVDDLFGDFDGDRDVDLADYGRIQLCFTGSDQNLATGCELGDLNGDDLLDHLDASTFPAVTTGP